MAGWRVPLLRLVGFGIGIFLCALGSRPAAYSRQDGRQAFRSSIDLVRIMVSVYDAHGAPMTGLGRDAFSVFDNGVPRDIAVFKGPLERSDGGTGAGTLDREGRAFLIVMDRGVIQGPYRVVDGISSYFLRQLLRREDVVAFAAYDRVSELSNDHSAIAAVVAAYGKSNTQIELALQQRESGLAGRYGYVDLPDHLRREVDSIFAPVAPRYTSVFAAGRGPALGPPALESEKLGQAGASLDKLIDGYYQRNISIASLLFGVRYLSTFPGERHLIAITGNHFSVGNANARQAIGDIASAANVAVHFIQINDLSEPDPLHAPRARTLPIPSSLSFDRRRIQEESAKDIAVRCGGDVAIYTRTADALAALLDHVDAEYTIGFVQNEFPSGMHAIDVKVNIRGAQVSFRRTYIPVRRPSS
jgi:VWFA-related protein